MWRPEEAMRAAAGAPCRPLDHEALAARTAQLRRRSRAMRLALAAVSVLVVAAAGVVLAAVATDDRSAVARTTTLEVPPVGEPVGTYLDDGTPVWVVHQEDGDVVVLEANAGDGTAEDFSHVWAQRWCPGTELFESHWSYFDLDGLRVGGPAPHGLARYEVHRVDDRTVEVPPRPPEPGTREQGERTGPVWGTWCDGGPGSIFHPEWAPDDGSLATLPDHS